MTARPTTEESPMALITVHRVSHRAAEDAPARPRVTLPYWLSGILAGLLIVASAAGLFVPGLYRDAPLWAAQARGTDIITLTVAVPALVVALILAARGSLRGEIVWLGVLGYATYMYAIFAFTVAFNP